MTGFIVAFCVAVCVIQCDALTTNNSSRIFMIDDELYAYVFSCASSQLVALSADRKSLLFYDINQQPPTPSSVVLPLPGELLQVSADGKRIAVAHDSYISTIENDMTNLKTYLTSVVKASSIVIVEEFVCLVPTFDQFTDLQCLNMNTGATCTSDSQVYAGSMAFVDTAKNWVYIEDQGMDKYNVSGNPRCLQYNNGDANPDFDTNDHLWFSYDGSRIFLASGMTLTASDDQSDMEPHGDFNSSHGTYRYSSFSQSSKFPNVIAGIRSDTNHTIYYYSWPYLNPIDSKKRSLPIPPQGRINGAEEVHICDESSTTYAIVKFTFSGNTTKIGVVTLD